MVDMDKSVKSPDCDSGASEFEPQYSPNKAPSSSGRISEYGSEDAGSNPAGASYMRAWRNGCRRTRLRIWMIQKSQCGFESHRSYITPHGEEGRDASHLKCDTL
jgi:hypothetical protein